MNCMNDFIAIVTESSPSTIRHIRYKDINCNPTLPESIPGGVTWDYFVATDRTMYPGVDSASKNEYQGLLLG